MRPVQYICRLFWTEARWPVLLSGRGQTDARHTKKETIGSASFLQCKRYALYAVVLPACSTMDVSRSALFEAKIHVYVVMLCFAVQARRQVEAQALKPKPSVMAQDLSGPNVRLLLEAVQGFLTRSTEEPPPAAAPAQSAPPPEATPAPSAPAAVATEEDMLEVAAQAAREAYQESMQKYEEANRLCQKAMAAKVAREQEEQKAKEQAEEERRAAAERAGTEDRVKKLQAQLSDIAKDKTKDRAKLKPCTLPLHKVGVYPLAGNDAQLELFARVRPLEPVDEAWEKKEKPRYASAPVEVHSDDDSVRKPTEPAGPPPARPGYLQNMLCFVYERCAGPGANGGLVL